MSQDQRPRAKKFFGNNAVHAVRFSAETITIYHDPGCPPDESFIDGLRDAAVTPREIDLIAITKADLAQQQEDAILRLRLTIGPNKLVFAKGLSAVPTSE